MLFDRSDEICCPMLMRCHRSVDCRSQGFGFSCANPSHRPNVVVIVIIFDWTLFEQSSAEQILDILISKIGPSCVTYVLSMNDIK